jgi:uncharacterized protein (DUF427 family)
MRAIWQGTVVAESEHTVIVERNHYFPREALKPECFRSSSHHSVCPWKGTAHYLDVVVGGSVNPQAAWFYPDPKLAAEAIRDRVAFWRGVEVRD